MIIIGNHARASNPIYKFDPIAPRPVLPMVGGRTFILPAAPRIRRLKRCEICWLQQTDLRHGDCIWNGAREV